MLRKVLFPTDLSKLSRKTLAWLADTLLQRGSEVILLHVVDPVLGLETPEVVRETEEEMERLAESLSPWGITGTPLVLAGDEREIIPKVAYSRKCSLAVHVAPSAEEAELMVQHLALPQLVLAGRSGPVEGTDLLRHLALTVDLSPERTPRLLEELARFLNGQKPPLSLVHVVHLEDAASADQLVVSAERALEEVKLAAEPLGSEVQALLGSGTPEQELPRIIQDLEPSLVVIGLSRHRELWELFLGSTSISMLRHLTCPILLLPV